MPVFNLKHSRTIHRREIRARLFRISFFTAPPPTSYLMKINCGTLSQQGYLPQWHPANQTSLTSVWWEPPRLYCRSSSRKVFRRWGLWSTFFGTSPHLRPSSSSSCVGRLKKFGLKRTRCSSRARAWRKALTCVLKVVNGSRLGIIPTDPTVSLIQHFQEPHLMLE